MVSERSSAAHLSAAGEAWRWMSVLHARLMDQLEQDAAAAGVVPFSWFEILSALEIAPDNRVRLGELVDTVLLTKAGVSRLLDRLERAGLLRRESCAADGRGAEAVLAPAGKTALAKARPIYAKTIQRHLGKYMKPAQAIAMIELTRSILAANDWLPDARPVALTVSKRPNTRLS